MTLETFFEKFDLFADAPGAVKKMRELVLELAVSGRLMPEILERSIENETKPMGSIVELVMGQAPSGDDCNAEKRGTVFVKVGEFGLLYPREEVWTTNPLKFAKKGDVLVCVVGATVGKLNLGIDCAIGRSVAAIRPSQALDTQFLYYSLIPYTIRLRRNSRGSAQGVIGKTELNAVSLWVPSRTVQERIVAKVDELMALCDRLEALQLEREAQAGQLARASLTRFADAPTPANLNHLFHSSFPISPSDLRKSILTLAVQGKLLPQDPNDELPKIPSHGQIVGDSEWVSRLKLPDTWLWARFESILAVLKNGFTGKPSKVVGKFKVTRIETIARETVDLARVGYAIDLPGDVVAKHAVLNGDILFSHINSEPHLGKTAICMFDDPTLVHGVNLLLLRPIPGIDSKYLNIALRELRAAGYFVSIAQRAVNQASINQKNLGKTPIPIPPLAEQRRIVAKVSELMALVDELETQLAASRAAAEKLLSGLVAELTNN